MTRGSARKPAAISNGAAGIPQARRRLVSGRGGAASRTEVGTGSFYTSPNKTRPFALLAIVTGRRPLAGVVAVEAPGRILNQAHRPTGERVGRITEAGRLGALLGIREPHRRGGQHGSAG